MTEKKISNTCIIGAKTAGRRFLSAFRRASTKICIKQLNIFQICTKKVIKFFALLSEFQIKLQEKTDNCLFFQLETKFKNWKRAAEFQHIDFLDIF